MALAAAPRGDRRSGVLARKNFQRDERLDATGDLDAETLTALDMREGSTAGSWR